MQGSDQEAVAATLKDRHAFSIIVERYQAPLLRYIRRLGVFDADAAKDVLQETFIKTYINLNDYNPSLPFNSWLYRIAHNETISHFRRMKNRPQALPESGLSLFESIPAELDIEQEVDAALRTQHIARALQELKPAYRDVLILRFFEEKNYEEISDILEIPSGTVASHIARGKRELAAVLTQLHGGVYNTHHG